MKEGLGKNLGKKLRAMAGVGVVAAVGIHMLPEKKDPPTPPKPPAVEKVEQNPVPSYIKEVQDAAQEVTDDNAALENALGIEEAGLQKEDTPPFQLMKAAETEAAKLERQANLMKAAHEVADKLDQKDTQTEEGIK